jgi:hypothetical protein
MPAALQRASRKRPSAATMPSPVDADPCRRSTVHAWPCSASAAGTPISIKGRAMASWRAASRRLIRACFSSRPLGPVWKKTVVAAASEFGGTDAVNGTGGTDHGTGGIGLVTGGAVYGGSGYADWTGLKASALKDGRDLPPRTDTRAIFKTVLADHLHVAKKALRKESSPRAAAPWLCRTSFAFNSKPA